MTREEEQRFQQSFFDQLHGREQMNILFDLLPNVYVFVKDRKGTFVFVNEALRSALGLRPNDPIIGKNDFDIHTPELATAYLEDDRKVMESKKGYKNIVWIVPNVDGVVQWFLASKIPLFSQNSEAIGIAGAMQNIRHAGAVIEPYERMTPVIHYIMDHLSEKIRMETLAKLTHLSISQFERTFKKLLKQTPSQYILQVRVNEACKRLTQTQENILNIALDCGFYDHSYFIRQFEKRAGMTPKEYRKRFYNE